LIRLIGLQLQAGLTGPEACASGFFLPSQQERKYKKEKDAEASFSRSTQLFSVKPEVVNRWNVL
jgi:hypothetical protein